MADLRDILYKVSIGEVVGTTQLDINAIVFDSRKAINDTLFVAIKGFTADGHDYIAKAIELGCKAIVCEKLPSDLVDGVNYIKVQDSSEALGLMASNFHDNPSKKLNLIGITGTNGKTTCVTLMFKLFRELGYNVGLLSTVENKINDEIIPSTHTTPDPVSLNELLAKMVNAGCTHCFMEVSSHSIVQRRIAGLDFNIAMFSNITHDHLDYHGDFKSYLNAKKKFFDDLPSSAFAVVNVDDKHGMTMVQNTKAKVKTYALNNVADFKAKILENTFEGLLLSVEGDEVFCRLIGDFNAYNLMVAYSAAILMEEDRVEVLSALSTLESAEGRFDYIVSPNQIVGIVDYAHTPDALEQIINTIKKIKEDTSKLYTIVGCGGDRDAEKRPIMAKIAVENSDMVVLTSDNPRTEDPNLILKDMQAGVPITGARKTLTISDRREAIKTACALAGDGDIILLAGKGHEKYQEINGVKHPFDDKEELIGALETLNK
jgi:UDP-N-acetylmuramoyl-L-alanyl-D-glutamate--2,6-diaminopimelate ligase